jgi:hypothetical protein
MFWAGGHPYGRDLEWVDDLVSPDQTARAAALLRFQQTHAEYYRVQREINEVWATAGSLRPREPQLAARLDRLRAEQDEAAGYSLMHTLWRSWRPLYRGPDWYRGDPAELIHYSLRYLEWEARFPADWHKHWITKAGQLEALAGWPQLEPGARARLAELVIAAVGRPHRCEDRGYVLAARAIDGPVLRQRIATQLPAPDQLTRQRAAFLLHLLDHPDRPASAAAWKRWLEQQGQQPPG